MPSQYGNPIDLFYRSQEWKRVREAKIRSQHGVCERCGRKGTEVHHIVPLTLDNIRDDSIRVGMGNLMLLCKSCHDAIRAAEQGQRCRFDAKGDLISLEDIDMSIPISTPRGRVPKK